MQDLSPTNGNNEAPNRVWSVKDFAERNHLSRTEEACLLQLFGSHATASELQYNVKRLPKHQ